MTIGACVLAASAGCGELPEGGVGGEPGSSTTAEALVVGPSDAELMDKIDPELQAAVAQGQARDVIVLLDERETESMRLASSALRPERTALLARGLNAQKQRLFNHLPMSHITTLADTPQLPVSILRIHAQDALLALARAPEVVGVVADRPNHLFVDANLALVNQPTAASAGNLGAGTAVAVLDTGTDYTRSAFGCWAAGTPASCKVAYAADFGIDDGSLDDNGHGTNVAGIVLAMAPATKILALDVFRGNQALTSDILSAISWVIANRAKYNIVAMNLSLGGGSYSAACAHDVFAGALASARAAGVIPVIAAGNEATPRALASPACVPAAVSVGAVYAANFGGVQAGVCNDGGSAADKVACFSNSAPFLTMLAPGVAIAAAGITMSGTSQATPHVAGAVAVLRAAFPSETVDQTLTRLTASGKSVIDARNGYLKPRLDLASALALAPPSSRSSTPGPTGTIEINGAAAYTNTTSVTIALATTKGTAEQVCVSGGDSCDAWRPSASTPRLTLSGGDGVKMVRAWFRDAAGNVSAAPASASITLDTTAPTSGQLSASVSATTVVWTWTGFADAASGIASYKVMTSAGQMPSGCRAGTPVYVGTAKTVSSAPPAAGKSAYYQVCAVDGAGNVSAGAQVRVSK
jgi:subtilisin family serine protease